MEIKKVELENIRSYEKAEINFPVGKVLLSGDIGTGKSSVLLAIEFALFGLQKGSLSGASLLRNGSDSGKVKVNFNIDGKEVIIERTLKRSKKGVAQEYGSIIFDEKKKDVSTQELKNHVLRMLNYPQEFMNKRPELYRYTVYTPQEEMKQILTENVETRLNTLRRVFAIDKYKRITENANIFLTKLRENIRNKEGMIADLDVKKEMLYEKKKESEEIDTDLKKIMPELEKAVSLVKEKREKRDAFEKKINELNQLRTNLATTESQIKTKTERFEEIREHMNEIEKDVKELIVKLKGIDIKEIPRIMRENIEKINKNNKEIKDAVIGKAETDKKIILLERRKAELQEKKEDINKLDICPTCSQKVMSDYKNSIAENIDVRIRKIEDETKAIYSEKDIIEKRVGDMEDEKKILTERHDEINEIRINVVNFEERQRMIGKLMDEQRRITENNRINEQIKKDIFEKINIMKSSEEDYIKARLELEDARESEKQIAIKRAETARHFQNMGNVIRDLEKEINFKEKIMLDISRFIKIRDWLTEQIIPLASHIEKNVMLKLHHEFSLFFEKWFNMLVASDGWKARLDENFTPIIEQAGFDTDYEFLSGGERTAAALAYRLSLNQVINSMLSHIKTRDLLVLDEPTDGFSAEQLDRMKDVFNEIKAKQIILVSHESKIENFVDNIIRFDKEGNISKIV